VGFLQKMRKLFDAPLVASAFEIGFQERGYTGDRHFRPDQSSAERNGIRIIVPACKRGRQRFSDLSAAACWIPVRGNGNSDAGAAHGDAALCAPVGQGLGEHRAVPRIIDAFVTVRAKIQDFVPLLAEPVGQKVLEIDASMIGGKSDAHTRYLAPNAAVRHRSKRSKRSNPTHVR